MAVMLNKGDVIKKYRIKKVLGIGGEGTAYLAKSPKCGAVVLKQANFAASDPSCRPFLERTKRTKRLLGRRTPYVAELLDSFKHDDLIYEVWEYISGQSLATRLERKEVMSEKEAFAIIVDVLRGLDVLHCEYLVIHRDIKPDNIMLPSEGPVKASIIDFGISRHLGVTRLTRRGLLGTPWYMPPEMLLGAEGPLDGRADLYAAGVTLYEMLAGTPPYTESDLARLIELVLADDPPRLNTHRPAVSTGVASFVHQLIRANPADRPASAKAALRPFVCISPETRPKKSTVSASADHRLTRVPRESKTLRTLCLRINSGPRLGTAVTIPPEGVAIGRNAIDPGDSRISRFHIHVTPVPGGLRIRDIGSINGLWSRGKRRRKLFVKTGQTVVIGSTTLACEETKGETP